MRVDVVTLFPEIFEDFLRVSFVGRARAGGQLVVRTRSPREFGIGKHKSVDDTPYGGPRPEHLESGVEGSQRPGFCDVQR